MEKLIIKKNKILALESMRGIAAISVAFFHFRIMNNHFNNDFIHNAWLMVDFFFVLSGFVISLNYIDRLNTLEDIFDFQVKRFLRLYPLHFLMLFIFLVIEFTKFYGETQFGLVATNNDAFSKNNLTAFVANLLLIQNWTLSEITFNYPSWSISAEFVTYALFAFLILICKSNRIPISIAFIICIIIFGILLNKGGASSLRCLYSFSIGVITFLIFRKLNNLNISINSIIPLIFIILSVFTVSKYGSHNFNFIVMIPLLFGFTVLSISLNSKESYLNKILSMNWLVFLGTISYGIYMIHAFVWLVIVNIFRFILKVPYTIDEEGTIRFLIENIYVANFISIIGISIVILLAHISFKYFEIRFTSK